MTHYESLLFSFKDVLAKTHKVIQKKEEKGYFGDNFGSI